MAASVNNLMQQNVKLVKRPIKQGKIPLHSQEQPLCRHDLPRGPPFTQASPSCPFLGTQDHSWSLMNPLGPSLASRPLLVPHAPSWTLLRPLGTIIPPVGPLMILIGPAWLLTPCNSRSCITRCRGPFGTFSQIQRAIDPLPAEASCGGVMRDSNGSVRPMRLLMVPPPSTRAWVSSLS